MFYLCRRRYLLQYLHSPSILVDNSSYNGVVSEMSFTKTQFGPREWNYCDLKHSLGLLRYTINNIHNKKIWTITKPFMSHKGSSVNTNISLIENDAIINE